MPFGRLLSAVLVYVSALLFMFLLVLLFSPVFVRAACGLWRGLVCLGCVVVVEVGCWWGVGL